MKGIGLRLADAAALGKRQWEDDAALPEPIEGLRGRKIARMTQSPHAFLRGSASLFYQVLALDPTLSEGPEDIGWITGDLHLENFGAFRTRQSHESNPEDNGAITFDLNDFDETTLGPLRFDILRLLTSLILASREFGASGLASLGMARSLIETYRAVLAGAENLPQAPRAVQSLVRRVGERTRKQFLDARTSCDREIRRLEAPGRYARIHGRTRDLVVRAFERYAAHLGPSEAWRGTHLKVEDVAFRIAGTGSLGSVRYGVLVAGKGGRDGGWIFDMKEEGESAAGGEPAEVGRGASRVLRGMGACLALRPMDAGETELEGRSMLVRRLTPQEDKLNLAKVDVGERESLAGYLGALTARAHKRGLVRGGKTPWSRSATERLIDQAALLATAHGAAFLSYCLADEAERLARTR